MTLKEFQDSVYCDEPRKANRSQDYTNWYYKKIQLFHERINGPARRLSYKSTPAQLFHFLNQKHESEYWSETIYTGKNLAQSEAKKYKAKVQQGWYCEEPDLHWFLIFDDLDMAIQQSYDELKKSNRI